MEIFFYASEIRTGIDFSKAMVSNNKTKLGETTEKRGSSLDRLSDESGVKCIERLRTSTEENSYEANRLSFVIKRLVWI